MSLTKNIIFPILAIIVGFSACKKDNDDASVLVGTWRSSGEPQIEISVNNEEAGTLIEREIKRMSTDNTIAFLGDGTFEQSYFDENRRQQSFSSGTYFRKDEKLYARYYISGHFYVTVSDLTISDNTNHITVFHNVTAYFKKSENLKITGIDDPAGVNVVKVYYTTAYERK